MSSRLPVLLIPGDIFANRRPDPVLQQLEDFDDGTVSVNDAFRPLSRYFDRISRPEHLLTAWPRARAGDRGIPPIAARLRSPSARTCRPRRSIIPRAFSNRKSGASTDPSPIREISWDVAAVVRAARSPVIVSGGGMLYSGAEQALARRGQTREATRGAGLALTPSTDQALAALRGMTIRMRMKGCFVGVQARFLKRQLSLPVSTMSQ